MNRINNSAKWAAVSAFVFLAAAVASGAVLLEDGFTDPAASHSKWLNSLDGGMSVAVSGGSCNLSNTSVYGGEYYHTFGTKPSTFTISFVLKSVSTDGGAGVLFCRSSGFNGYYLTLHEDGVVALYKYVNGDGSTIYNGNSVDINPSDNKLTVSKQGSEIHLFVNDLFQGKVTDAAYNSGDVSLFVSENTSAVFGAFEMTDAFTPGKPRSSFSDNFDNGRSKYWEFLSVGEPEISDAAGALTVKTGADVNSWMYVEMPLTDFTARVDVRHLGGGTTINDMYGIVLVGVPQQTGPVQMVYFGITGGRWYSVWSGSPRPDLVQDLVIKGSAGNADVIYIDTLEVSKKSGSSTYEFAVNGKTLSADYPVVNFEITGIGIFSFSDSDMRIVFDNFEAKKEGATSIKFGRNPQAARGNIAKNITVAKNALNLKVDNNAVIRIFGLNGRELRKINLTRGDHSVRLSSLPKGMYMANVAIDGEKRTLRVPVR